MLRTVYFGTPEFAVPGLEALLDSGHEVVALVCQPDRPKGRGQRPQPPPTKIVAAARGIPVFQPTRLKDEAFLTAIAALRADLGVVAAYGRILPDPLLALPSRGMINIHASLLPKYRGAAPVHRAVIAGEAETGVTIMRVVSELDAGAAFATARHPIGPDETTPEVERALARLGAPLMRQVVEAIASGTARETPQDHQQATYAAKIEKHEGTFEWTLPAAVIHNRVRGLQPWPLVSAAVNGTRCLIHRTALTDEMTTALPGTILSTDGGLFPIASGDGRVIRILQLQPEGKRLMSARDFLAGRRPMPGSRLQPA